MPMGSFQGLSFCWSRERAGRVAAAAWAMRGAWEFGINRSDLINLSEISTRLNPEGGFLRPEQCIPSLDGVTRIRLLVMGDSPHIRSSPSGERA